MKTKLYSFEKGILRVISYRLLRTKFSLILFAFLFVIAKSNYAQTLSFTQLTADYSRPNSGAETWYNGFQVGIANVTPQDRYIRFSWSALQSTSATSYTWTIFDQEVNKAIDAGQKFSFGIMTQYLGGAGSSGIATYGGGASAYPLFLHNQMQAESTTDYLSDGDWVPNYNSNSFLTAFENLCNAIYNHLQTTTYKGALYKNVINSIDIRGYGNFGEFHNWPYGTGAVTPANLKRIIDAHKNEFPDIRLSAMISGMGDSWSDATPEISYYLLTQTNSAGPFGIRRDNWGATEDWYNAGIWENNPRTYNGVALKTLIMDKYKTAPITGEPCCNSGYTALPSQVTKYHVVSFGNGNYGSVTNSAIVSASQLAGARIVLTGGSVNTSNGLSVTLNWRNTGNATIYDTWNVIYELKNTAGTTVWTGNSGFTLKLFLPQTSATSYTDNFTLPTSVTAGTYKLNLIIKDPKAYRAPYPLGISGRNTDGSYTLTNVTVSNGTGSTNMPPVADAGANQIISLAVGLATLNSSNSSDPDGTIASRQWQQISGPGTSILSSTTATTVTVTSLLAGTYTYRLTVTDNDNATATDDVTVTVNPLINIPPVANAGTDKTITLPTNSTTLSGSASTDADGTISGYQWQQVSGPNTSTFSSITTANITVSNLVAGTYTYRLTVTDNNNATSTDNVTVTVNPAANVPPVANAGTDKTITLPTNSTTLSGSASTDANGTITGYQWQQVSGPNTSTFSSTTTANITVGNLVAGTYTYRLTVTDNNNATSTDNVTVTVNPAVNVPPVADAGTNRTITLPINSTTLNGNGSTDADGTISSYQWQQISGPNTSTFSSTTTANITVSNLVAGTYTYRLTVTDNNNATSTDNVTVTVNPAVNVPPVADAGTNQTITLPTNSAILNGGSSSDPDGTIASYQWQQISGPNTSTFSSTTTANITVSNLVAGTYTYRLTVTDNNNATATDNVTVTVNAAPVANVLPVSNAGPNRTITLPTNSVILNGSSSFDPDGSITSYQWQQISGPNTSTFSSTTTANITVSNLVAGIYTYRLTVKDNNNATATDDVTVTVNPVVNVPPVADAGANRTITLPTNSSNLNGSSSYDADGTISSYQWQQISGPNTATFSSTTTANITVSNLVAGTYVFRLTVRDNNNATATDDVSVIVNPAVNIPPVADAGANRTITLPTNSSNLNGASSYDADGTISSYQWQQISGPNTATFSSTTAASITVSNLVAGTYVFRLTVRDNNNSTATDDVTIIVNPAVNVPPVADAGANRTITLPTNSSNLNGSSSYDADGTISSYQWQQISGPNTATFSSTTAASITVSNLVAGTYVFRLTVRDNNNATATDDVTVIVNPAVNIPPVANAGSNRTIILPTNSATLNGSGSDADGTITSYQWQQISGPNTATFSSTTTANITVSNLVAGTYVFRLTVRDNNNVTATDDVTIIVSSAANIPPIANAGINQATTLTTNSVTLDGSASTDPDGTITSYQWQQISGPNTATFSSTTGAIVTISSLQAGDYAYKLTVKDNNNATDVDTVLVSVVDNFFGHGEAVIYPNPANDIVNVSLKSPEAGNLRIRISDMAGKQVLPISDVAKPQGVYTTSVNVSTLAPGTYILEVLVNKTNKTVSKFIKL